MSTENSPSPASQREKLAHETLGPDFKPAPISVTTWTGGREENQDAFFSFAVMPESYYDRDLNEKENLKALSAAGYELVMVADGMGGHQGGAEASKVLTQTVMRVFAGEFARYYAQTTNKSLATASPEEIQQFVRDKMPVYNLKSLLRYAIVEGNKSIQGVAGYAEASKKPGSTIVASFFDRNTNKHVIANVGDSRAQKITQGGKLEQVTEDHSVVQRLLKAKVITEEEAQRHPARNEIYRSLNGQKIEKPVEYIDTFEVQLKPGEVLILNSDGLEVLSRDEIEKVVKEAKKDGTTIDRALVAAVDRKQLLALAEKIEFSGLLTSEEIKKIFEENAHQMKNSELAKLLFEKVEEARREAIYQELRAINVPGWVNKPTLAEKLRKGEVIADAVIGEAQQLANEGTIEKSDVNHLLNGKKFRKIEGYNHDNITVIIIGEVKNTFGTELINRAKSLWDSVINLFIGKDKKTSPATPTAQSPEQADAKPEKTGSLAKVWKWLISWKERRAAKRSAAEIRTASQSPEVSTGLTVEQSIQALLAILKTQDRNLLLKLGLIKNTQEEDDDSEAGGLADFVNELSRDQAETIQNREKITDLEARIEENRQAERDIATEVHNYLISLYGHNYLNHLSQDNRVYINRCNQDILGIRAIRADLERELEQARQEMGETDSSVKELTIDGLAFNPKRRRQVKLALERVISSNEDETKVANIRDALQKHLHALEASAWKPFEKLQQKPLFMKIKGIFEKLSGYTKTQWENRPRTVAEWKDRARDKSIERWEKRKDSYNKKEQVWRTSLNLESVTPEELTAWELALRKGQTLEARQVVALVLEQRVGSIPELNKHKKVLREAGIDLQHDLMDWLRFQWEKKLTDERIEADENVRKLKEAKANSPEARKELRKAIVAQTEAYLKWLNLKVYDHVKKSAILEAQLDRFGRPNATGIAKEDIEGTGWRGLVNNLKRYMSMPKMTAGQRDVAYYVTYFPSMIGLLTAPGLTAGAKNVIMGVTSGVSVGGEVIKQRIEAQYGGDSEAYWESLRAKEGLSSKVIFALQRIAVSKAVQSVRDGISGGAMAAQVSSLLGFDTFAYQLRESIDRAAQGLSGELPADLQEIVDQHPEIVSEMEDLQAELDRVTEEAAQQADSLRDELSDAQQAAKDLEVELGDAQQAAKDLEAELERKAQELLKEQEKVAEAAKEAAERSAAAQVTEEAAVEAAKEVTSKAVSHLPEALADYGDQVVQMKGGDFLGDVSALWTANRNLSAELDPANNANSMAGFLTRAFRALNPGVDPAKLDPEKTYNFLTEEAVKALLPEIRAAEKAVLERGIQSLDLPQQLMAAGIDGFTHPTFNDEQLALVLETVLNK